MSQSSPQKPRPPVVVIMGHIDHGKSTLLDYIRKTNIVAGEAGGITQHISAYEAEVRGADNETKRITFLDTPGHEAFSGMRARGANAADIAILVISAEDSVKTQTLEALASIKKARVPYIVAINKIDKPAADIARTKNDLLSHEVYLEGYGGDVPSAAISAKTGEGIPELLELVLLSAELAELSMNSSAPMEGVVIESHMDPKKGISATVIIKNGTVRKGMFVAAGGAYAPVRILENFSGSPIDSASASSPVIITGWNTLPETGSLCVSFDTKTEAEAAAKNATLAKNAPIERHSATNEERIFTLPIIVKTDTAGSLEAIQKEINNIQSDQGKVRILHAGVGDITENDLKLASATKDTILVGFHTNIHPTARAAALRTGTPIHTFDIIYKITEWLSAEIAARAPKTAMEELSGEAKIIKVFSGAKHKQIVGGKVAVGTLAPKTRIKIYRRDNEIGTGEITGLENRRTPVQKVEEGNEFGAMISANIDIAAGDAIKSFATILK